MQALYTSATGMKAATITIDVIAHNLANGSTTAFKRRRAEFEDLMYVDNGRSGAQSDGDGVIRPTNTQQGLGSTLSAVFPSFLQGPTEITGNEFDLSINGKGFFRVTLPDGTENYTRTGVLKLSQDGTIVTTDGYPISPGIQVPEDAINVNINANGEVLVLQPGQAQPANLGRFDLVRFQNETGLESRARNLYGETQASGPPVEGNPNDNGFGFISQGSLEGSNVDTVVELTDMIKAQRLFELNVKVLEAANQSMQTLNQSA